MLWKSCITKNSERENDRERELQRKWISLRIVRFNDYHLYEIFRLTREWERAGETELSQRKIKRDEHYHCVILSLLTQICKEIQRNRGRQREKDREKEGSIGRETETETETADIE